jgi:hypothetical protein
MSYLKRKILKISFIIAQIRVNATKLVKDIYIVNSKTLMKVDRETHCRKDTSFSKWCKN